MRLTLLQMYLNGRRYDPSQPVRRMGGLAFREINRESLGALKLSERTVRVRNIIQGKSHRRDRAVMLTGEWATTKGDSA